MSRAASRMFVAAFLLASATPLLAACSDRVAPPPTPTPAPLSLADWAEQFCTLSAEAADTLDVPRPEDPETLTLDERREWVLEVVAPRVEALEGTAEALAAMPYPPEVVDDAGGFLDIHETLQSEVARIALAWRQMVVAARSGSGEVNTANEGFIRISESYYYNNWVVSDDTREALSQPQDCGILNGIRSRVLTPTTTQPLSLDDWAEQVCALSAEAADMLDIPGGRYARLCR